MKHEDIRHKLSEYIDGSITPAERTAIDEHLKSCTACADALAELRKTIEHIHEVEDVEPPAWMTQKIMAKVREEQAAKSGFWQKISWILTMRYPIQALTVLFLAVTAYYIYQGIDPSRKYTEEPVGTFAKKDAPVTVRPEQRESETTFEAAPEPKRTPREPGYRSLDMKYAYEKPAAPVPQEQPASAPAPAKQETPALARDEAAGEKRAAVPRAAAPSMMAEQAAPAAGAGLQLNAAKEPVLNEQKKKSFTAEDREADNLLDVTEHFVKFDLPGHMKKQGLRYSTRKFVMDLPDLRWMQETAAFRSVPCALRYVVDVEFSGQSSKYLYCRDQSRIRLLGIYELQQDTWSEKRP